MVKRYEPVAYCEECEEGDCVLYEGYAAMQAENERLKAVIEAVRAEL